MGSCCLASQQRRVCNLTISTELIIARLRSKDVLSRVERLTNDMSVGPAGKKAMVQMARAAGMSDAEILKEILANEFGPEHRRELVVEWAEYLGLSAIDALKIAQSAHLIPTSAPPRSSTLSRKGKPRGNTPGSKSE